MRDTDLEGNTVADGQDPDPAPSSWRCADFQDLATLWRLQGWLVDEPMLPAGEPEYVRHATEEIVRTERVERKLGRHVWTTTITERIIRTTKPTNNNTNTQGDCSAQHTQED